MSKQPNKSIIYVTNRINKVKSLAERVLVLDQGALVMDTSDVPMGLDFYYNNCLKNLNPEGAGTQIAPDSRVRLIQRGIDVASCIKRCESLHGDMECRITAAPTPVPPEPLWNNNGASCPCFLLWPGNTPCAGVDYTRGFCFWRIAPSPEWLADRVSGCRTCPRERITSSYRMICSAGKVRY
jgi:hypothetical protein